MSNAEFMEIITKVLSNFDPTKTEDQDAAVFASTFNHFEKKERKRHRKVVKKVNDNYFVELEKREKEEAARNEKEAQRRKNNEMLK